MDHEEIARRRMRAQGLWGAPLAHATDAVRRLTAVQAQEHAYARWSIGQRSRTTATAFDRAFDNGSILRTHVLRPTWHYVAPDDLRWLMQLTGPRVRASSALRYRRLGLDGRTLNRANDVIARAVAIEPRTRRELGAELDSLGISTEGQRLPHMLMHAELDAVICSGPMRDKQHTYAAFDTRVTGGEVARDESLATLACRYFTTRGPATVKDFAWWSGLAMADAREGLSSASHDLDSRDVDGRSYWFSKTRHRATRAPRVDLVQCYDEAIISYTESRDVLVSPRADFPVPRHVDGFVHVVLLDGRLLGHWRLVRTRSTSLETRIGSALAAPERDALAKAIDRFRRFWDEPLA